MFLKLLIILISGNHQTNSPPYNPYYNSSRHEHTRQQPHNSTINPAGYGNNLQDQYHLQGGGGGVTIINNNINNHHAWNYPSPVYTTHDTGDTALGFYLGYALGKLSTPSYHYHNSYYDEHNYTPRYDHYTVHHYYHNKETVPKEATIESNAIVACVGDSGSLCPTNTTSLCTNNGVVMCVATATSTIPCTNEKQSNCVKSIVSCKDNNSPECKQASQGTASISIPCISTANVYGNITYVNNSIVISNTTAGGDGPGSRNITVATNAEKGPSQMFCVTVLAVPAERKLTEGEKLFSRGKEILSRFAIKALGID